KYIDFEGPAPGVLRPGNGVLPTGLAGRSTAGPRSSRRAPAGTAALEADPRTERVGASDDIVSEHEAVPLAATRAVGRVSTQRRRRIEQVGDGQIDLRVRSRVGNVVGDRRVDRAE